MGADFNARFAEDLQRRRTERGWSKKHLADLVGVSDATVANIEARSNGPSLRVACALAAALGTTVDQMTGMRPAEVAR